MISKVLLKMIDNNSWMILLELLKMDPKGKRQKTKSKMQDKIQKRDNIQKEGFLKWIIIQIIIKRHLNIGVNFKKRRIL